MDTGTVERLNVAFNEDETNRVLRLAEAYADHCHRHGREPPGDAVRALLEAAEAMELRLAYIATAYELAQWQADGGIES